MGKNCVFLAISYTKRKKVENAIRSYLESKGLEVITGRDMASGGNLCDEIITLIKECDFGVVVYNELRHNISYEWGLLDAMRRYVVVLKDENIHIDLDYELSDKKGTNLTQFYGEDTEEEIIQQLKEDKGLEKALENNIEKRISSENTPEAKKASELLVKSDLQLGEIPKNIKELPNSEEILEALEEIKNLTAEGHFIKGNAFYSEKQFEKALEEYNITIDIDSKYPETYLNRGVIYEQLGSLEKAMEDYNKAIDLDPENALFYNNRGIVYDKLGSVEKAMEDYNKAIDLDPENALSYSNRGVIYEQLFKFEDALICHNKAIDIDPENANFYYNRGVIFSKLDKFEEALVDYNKAIDLDTKNDLFYSNREATYLKLGKFEEALIDCNKAIDLDPDNVMFHLNVAELYIIKKDIHSLILAKKALSLSKNKTDIIVSKLLITINILLQGKGKKEETELIEYVNQNKGYKLTFEFDTLKTALKDSKYSTRINKLIQLVEENAV